MSLAIRELKDVEKQIDERTGSALYNAKRERLKILDRLTLPRKREQLEAAALSGSREALNELALCRPKRVEWKVGGYGIDELGRARSSRVTVYVGGEHLATYGGESVLRAYARLCAWEVRKNGGAECPLGSHAVATLRQRWRQGGRILGRRLGRTLGRKIAAASQPAADAC